MTDFVKDPGKDKDTIDRNAYLNRPLVTIKKTEGQRKYDIASKKIIQTEKLLSIAEGKPIDGGIKLIDRNVNLKLIEENIIFLDKIKNHPSILTYLLTIYSSDDANKANTEFLDRINQIKIRFNNLKNPKEK